MSVETYANGAATTLSSNGGSISSGATSFNVASSALFPTTGNFRVLIGSELILVGANSGGTFSSCTRGVEGTSAASHNDGDAVTQIITAASVREVIAPVGFPSLTVPPSSGSWTQRNFAGATLTDNGRSLTINAAAAGSGTNLCGLDIAVPSLSYSITAAFLMTWLPGKPWHQLGLYWSDGTKIVAFVFGATGTNTSGFRVVKFNSTGSYSADYNPPGATGYATPLPFPIWMRISEDASNRTCSWSGDGVTFIQFHQIGRTDFLTATRVGWSTSGENAATPNIGCAATLISWKQT